MPAPGREGCGRKVSGVPGSGGRAAAGILGPLLILAIGLVLTFSRPPGMAGEQEMPDDLVIETSGYRPDRKGAVGFSHLAHNEDYDVACNVIATTTTRTARTCGRMRTRSGSASSATAR